MDVELIKMVIPEEYASPAPLEKEKMPPSRLAARQIVYEISMRSQREQQEKQRAVVGSKQGAENEWRDRVACLTSESHQNLPVEKIKVLIVVLSRHLSIAPNYEEALSLELYIKMLSEELVRKTHCLDSSSPSALSLNCSDSSFDEGVSRSDSFP